jgi:signal transduction histidine kinase
MKEELLGNHLKILVPESAGPDPIKFLTEAYKRSIAGVSEWEGRRKSGEIFPFELALFEFHAGNDLYIAGSIRDLSEKREVDRLKKEFISTVSHELRTPLTSIRGSLSLLASGVLGEFDAETREVINIAERNSIRLIGLINDILDLEKLETGKLEMDFTDVQLSKVFERSIESVRVFAEDQGVAIEIDPVTASVRGNEDRLVQVLVNLLSNAVKFSSKGSLVKVVTEEHEEAIEVKVIDHGRGIPAQFKEVIFERFRQIEATDSRQKGGTGLGLAICKSIIELHNGTIEVESEEGKGSIFWFRVPSATIKMIGGEDKEIKTIVGKVS